MATTKRTRRNPKNTRLFSSYGFDTETQYFEYIVDSVINGQRTQAKELFCKLNDEQARRFLSQMTVARVWDAYLSDSDKQMFIEIF